MADIVLLILVGSITYLLFQRSLARLSTVSWRLLWGIMIAPPTLVVLTEKIFQIQFPPPLVLLLFLGSYLTTAFLLRRGQPIKPSMDLDAQEKRGEQKPDPTLSAPIDVEVLTALAHTPISEVPRQRLQDCFPWNMFYLQNVEYRPQAIICRGNLRADPSEAYDRVRNNVETTFGNRFLVVLQEGLAGKPFFALVPNPSARRLEEESDNPGLAISLFLLSVLTTLMTGALLVGVPANQIFQPMSLLKGGPYALAILTILGIHEWARYAVARWHGIKTSLPYFIPIPFALGTFGAFLQLRQPVPNRKILFDLGISGPLAGSIVAIVMLGIGLVFSTTVPLSEEISLQPIILRFQEVDPGLSLLLGILAKMVMGSRLEVGQALQLHPLAFGGWLGLVVIALNLMPVGQLDGGHVVHAVYGQHMGANVGRIARILVLLLALLQVQPWLWLWALLLFFISSADEPALNDVTDLNEGRDLLGLLALTLLVLIILPFPPFLRPLLGWG